MSGMEHDGHSDGQAEASKRLDEMIMDAAEGVEEARASVSSLEDGLLGKFNVESEVRLSHRLKRLRRMLTLRDSLAGKRDDELGLLGAVTESKGPEHTPGYSSNGERHADIRDKY